MIPITTPFIGPRKEATKHGYGFKDHMGATTNGYQITMVTFHHFSFRISPSFPVIGDNLLKKTLELTDASFQMRTGSLPQRSRSRSAADPQRQGLGKIPAERAEEAAGGAEEVSGATEP